MSNQMVFSMTVAIVYFTIQLVIACYENEPDYFAIGGVIAIMLF